MICDGAGAGGGNPRSERDGWRALLEIILFGVVYGTDQIHSFIKASDQ